MFGHFTTLCMDGLKSHLSQYIFNSLAYYKYISYLTWSVKTSKLYIEYYTVCICNLFNTTYLTYTIIEQPIQSNPGIINNKELELLLIEAM